MAVTMRCVQHARDYPSGGQCPDCRDGINYGRMRIGGSSPEIPSKDFSLAHAILQQEDLKLEFVVPMLIWCPMCNKRHIDEGEFATKPHHTHSCQHCGTTWRPAIINTVGVLFLPGFENKPIKEVFHFSIPEDPKGWSLHSCCVSSKFSGDADNFAYTPGYAATYVQQDTGGSIIGFGKNALLAMIDAIRKIEGPLS